MEIVDYLRAARRRLALIILIPLVAAGGAAALLFLQPQMYVATATADLPALVGGPTSQYTGARGVIQFVAAFQATARARWCASGSRSRRRSRRPTWATGCW